MLKDKVEFKRIFVYIAITFALSYLIGFIFIVPGTLGEGGTAITAYGFWASLIMMVPAIGNLCTRIITKEGMKDHMLKWTWNKENTKYYLMSWLAPSILVIVGTLIYFIIFPEQYDWNMTYFHDKVTKSGTIAEIDALRTTIISQLITAVILGPVVNCITCFGEEWGWRGYLLPKLIHIMPTKVAVVVSGAIWGLWHLPLIIAGHNYGIDYPGYPFAGIAMMILFCIFTGIFNSYVCLKANSCIPGIIVHGAINSIAAVGVYFTYDGGNQLLGPACTGIIGMIPIIITSVVLLFRISDDNACRKDSSCDKMNKVLSDGDGAIG